MPNQLLVTPKLQNRIRLDSRRKSTGKLPPKGKLRIHANKKSESNRIDWTDPSQPVVCDPVPTNDHRPKKQDVRPLMDVSLGQKKEAHNGMVIKPLFHKARCSPVRCFLLKQGREAPLNSRSVRAAGLSQRIVSLVCCSTPPILRRTARGQTEGGWWFRYQYAYICLRCGCALHTNTYPPNMSIVHVLYMYQYRHVCVVLLNQIN